MSITSFPKGWQVLSGELGTDVTVSTSVNISGGTSIYWPSTASNDAVVVSDWVPIQDNVFTGYQESAIRYYSFNAIVQASSVALGKDIKVEIESADQTRTTINSRTIYNSNLSTANRWQPVGDIEFSLSYTSARWIRFKISRPTDLDFDLYIDSVEAKQLPVAHTKEGTSGTFTSSWAALQLNSIQDINNAVTWDSSNYRADVHYPGLYQVNCSVGLGSSRDVGDVFSIRLVYRPTGSGSPKYIYGSSVTIHTTTNLYEYGLTASGIIYLEGTNSTSVAHVGAEIVQYGGNSAKGWSEGYLSLARITDR